MSYSVEPWFFFFFGEPLLKPLQFVTVFLVLGSPEVEILLHFFQWLELKIFYPTPRELENFPVFPTDKECVLFIEHLPIRFINEKSGQWYEQKLSYLLMWRCTQETAWKYVWGKVTLVEGTHCLSQSVFTPSFPVAHCSQKHIYYRKFALRKVFRGLQVLVGGYSRGQALTILSHAFLNLLLIRCSTFCHSYTVVFPYLRLPGSFCSSLHLFKSVFSSQSNGNLKLKLLT